MDTTKAKGVSGYASKIFLSAGLRDVTEWYDKKHKQQDAVMKQNMPDENVTD